MTKRGFDLTFSLIALFILSPFLVIVWLAIIFTSSGPGLFKQKRVGQYGQFFYIYKFRTMVNNASELGGYQTKEHDSRITWLGNYLRRTSIDELPQLINIFRGEMSFVGPRPDTPMQEERYEPWEWKKRVSVRPGLTGLAQATKRSLADHDERLRMDFDYIDNHDVILDLKILFLTLTKLSGKGSN